MSTQLTDEQKRRMLEVMLGATATAATVEDELQRAQQRPRQQPTVDFDTTIVDRATIRLFSRRLLQVAAPFLFYFALIGSVGAFTDVKPMLATPFPWIFAAPRAAIIGGIIVQVILSLFEYNLAPKRLTLKSLVTHKWYTLCLFLDTALTVYGYRVVVIPWIAGTLVLAMPGTPLALATFAALFIAWIGAAALAVLPERIFIRS
jgi:hypothetical protein